MNFPDYYDVLGLPRFYPTQEEIRDAFLKKLVQLNESGAADPNARQDLDFAYLTLSDAKKKRQYDEVLHLYINEALRDTSPVVTCQSPKTRKTIRDFGNGKTYCAVVIAIFVLCAFGVYWKVLQITDLSLPAISNPLLPEANRSAEETLTTVQRPRNGHIFQQNDHISYHTGTYSYSYAKQHSEFCVKTRGSQDYLIKLQEVNNENQFGLFYVRGGSEALIDVEPGTYILKYACGDGNSWYGTKRKFGTGTSYARVDEWFTFTETRGWTVELYLHADGNLSKTYIDEDEF